MWAGQPHPGPDFTTNGQIPCYCSERLEMNFFLYISKGINGKFLISDKAGYFLKGL